MNEKEKRNKKMKDYWKKNPDKCEEHKKKMREYQKEKRKNPEYVKEQKVRCDKWRENNKELIKIKRRERYLKNKKLGICIHCEKNKARKNRVTCGDCA